MQQTVEALSKQLEAKGDELQKVVGERDAQAKAASEDAELTLLQLHQVQEELEQLFLKNQEKASLLKTTENQVAELKEELELASASQTEKEAQAKAASEEAELTLLQLHQVQEELEHYFLRSQSADQLAAAQKQQLMRAQTLISRLLPIMVQTNAYEASEQVTINPEVTPLTNPVQTEALLGSYQKSLARAAALLQRAIRS